MSGIATDAPRRGTPELSERVEQLSPRAAPPPDLVAEAGPIDWPGLVRGARGHLVLSREVAFAHPDWMRGRQVYLASPVTSWAERGFAVACEVETARVLGQLLALGLSVVCPGLSGLVAQRIAQGRERDRLDGMSHAAWMRVCLPLLAASDAVIVAPMAGWRESRGIWAECVWAAQHDRPVILMEPLDA